MRILLLMATLLLGLHSFTFGADRNERWQRFVTENACLHADQANTNAPCRHQIDGPRGPITMLLLITETPAAVLPSVREAQPKQGMEVVDLGVDFLVCYKNAARITLYARGDTATGFVAVSWIGARPDQTLLLSELRKLVAKY